MKRLRSAGVSMVLALIVTCLLGSGSASANPASPPTTCFWTGAVAAPYATPTTNVNFPDTGANYWYTRYHLPAGGKVILRGTYPYARYISMIVYHPADAGTPGTLTDGVNDQEIAPDEGSANPFTPGAVRLTLPSMRRFTVTLSGDAPPPAGSPRDPNTIYTGTAGLAGTTQTIELIYRVYVPNVLADSTGDVGLPEPTYVPASGPRRTGQALCDTLQNNGDQLPDALGPVFGPKYSTLQGLSPLSTHPAVNRPVWYSFFNGARLTEPFYVGTPAEGQIASLPTAKTGGVYSNRDNSYAYSYIDRSFGPDAGGHNVLVLRGRIPTTPRTKRWNPVMQRGMQMRYWSLCQNEGLATGRVASPCLFDEQIPRDADGWYTIVASLSEDRPANARAACGVAWLDWGASGDGLGRTRAGLLILRNMLPAASFTQVPASVIVPGTEKSVMGDYLPEGSYESKAQFQARGCHR